MISHPNRSSAFEEPPVPAGMEAGQWIRWNILARAACIFGLNDEATMNENMSLHALLDRQIAAGKVQQWKRGPHQQSAAYYRYLWKAGSRDADVEAMAVEMADKLKRRGVS